MKVKNTSIYIGQDTQALRHSQEQSAATQKNPKSITAGNLNQQDSILLKKKQAQQKALKIVGDTFAAERKLDEEQESRRDNVKELTKQANELKGYIEDYESMPEDEMTEEMKADRDEALKEYQKQYDSVQGELKAELTAIETVSIERLKSSPMAEAKEQAQDILEAASEEIVGMLMQEAKDHIDEEQEKREEKAEEIAEKRAEEEERLEKSEEKKEENEAMVEAIREFGKEDLQQEINEMLDKLKLIEEDIKGAAVDTKL